MAIQHGEQKERISLEAFFALVESDPEHRYEYIDGYPSMMPGGTPDHSIIGANMNRILGEQLRKRPCIVYNSDVYIELSDGTNCLCPDGSVSCDRRDRHAVKVIHYPCVVAEVISSGTKARNLVIKSEFLLRRFMKKPPLTTLLQTIKRTNPRRDGVVELHEDDECDTHVGVDDAEQRAEGIERLRDDDATFGCGTHFDSRLVFHKPHALRITPTGEEHGAKQENIE